MFQKKKRKSCNYKIYYAEKTFWSIKKDYWQKNREARLEYRQEEYERERDNILIRKKKGKNIGTH